MIFKELLGNSGITHIEELPLEKFLNTISHLDQYRITEKVDGSEILFGIDEHGFYTSRETKGGDRVYEADNYPLNFSTTYMRSAHTALESVLWLLEEGGLKIGDQVEAEVLFGEIPNAIPYSEDFNHIIFLRTTEGFVKVKDLNKVLKEQELNIPLTIPYTPDGKTIELKEEIYTWKFSQVPEMWVDHEKLQEDLRLPRKQLSLYLGGRSNIEDFSNFEISQLPLNKCPEWCKPQDWKEIKEDVKRVKTQITKTINENLIPKIKSVLLDHLVSTQTSEFGPLRENAGWIEGVVLQHKKTGEQFKIVDKEVFTKVRNFLWEERVSLTEKSYSVDETRSFLGNLYVGLGSSVGHAELGTKHANRYMKLLGESKEEVLEVLTEGTKFDETKDYWISFLDSKEKELNKRLQEYENKKNKKSIDVQIAGETTTFSYNEAIDTRTKQVFAEMFARIETLREGALNATTSEDLIVLLVGERLNKN